MDPEEIVRDLKDAILREPGGDEIARIDSVDVGESGRALLFEVDDFGAGEKYRWTVSTQQVIDEAGSMAAVDDVQSAVLNLYTRDEGYRSVLESGSPLDSGSPGPGDPDLDL